MWWGGLYARHRVRGKTGGHKARPTTKDRQLKTGGHKARPTTKDRQLKTGGRKARPTTKDGPTDGRRGSEECR